MRKGLLIFSILAIAAEKPRGRTESTDKSPSTSKSEEKTPAEVKNWNRGDAPAMNWTTEDQFGRRQEAAAHKGDVLVFIYHDRKASDAARDLYENLHVLFHPDAAGKTPGKGRGAPVAPLPGLPEGSRSPDATIIRVYAPGPVGPAVKDIVRSRLKKSSPDVPIWIDFGGTLEKEHALRAGETNLLVIDGAGKVRMRVNGTLDAKGNENLLQTIQDLRAESLKP